MKTMILILVCAASAWATDGTWTGAGADSNYSNTNNWLNNILAFGTDATMTVTNPGATITIDTNVTIGSFVPVWNNGTSRTLRGAAGKTLTFAVSSGTPLLSIQTWFSRYDYVTNLAIAGSSGLRYRGGSNVLVLQSNVTWASFSGGFTLEPPGYGDGAMFYAQAANVLPVTDFTFTPGTANTGYQHAKLVLNGACNQTIGALNSSLVSTTGNAYISTYTGGSLLTGGTPSGGNSNAYSTITIGVGDNSGTFRGKLGTGYANGTQTEDTNAHLIAIYKIGAGTQTFSGTNRYSGTTTITNGTLLVNGTHTPPLVTGLDTGKYIVLTNGTLGGTGTITPATTNTDGGVMFSIAGTLAPGNNGIGTLTLDGTNAAKSLVAFENGARLQYDLGASLTSDRLVLTNATSNEVFFNSGNVINFNDTTSGSLGSGQFVLIRSSAANSYSGLSVDGSSVITNGLTIGTGLSSYPGSALKIVGNDIVLDVPAPQTPAAPTGLTNTTSGAQVTLGWVAAATATNYVVYRSTTPNGTYVAIGTTTGTSYTDTTALNGTTYYYKVSAVNTYGEGPKSTSSTATPLDPATTTILSINLRSYNSFGMAVWDVAGVDRVGFWNNLVGPTILGESVTLTSLTDQRGLPVTNVVVSFTAGTTTSGVYDNSGTLKVGTESTNEATLFATAFDQYNGTASSLTVSNLPFSSYDVVFYFYDGGSSRGGSVTLTGTTYYVRGGLGNPATNGTGYAQSDDTTLGTGTDVLQGNFVRYNSLTGSNFTATFVANNLGDSTQRFKIAGFQIVSHDAVPVPSAPPAAPTGVTASGGLQQVALNWNLAPTASVYVVKRSLSSGSDYSTLATLNSPLVSFCDTGVVNGTTYYYVVAATNSAGTSANSAEVSATPNLPAFTPVTDSVYQYSVPVVPIFSNNQADPYRRAYLWVPPSCTKLQGVVVGLHNMLEKPMFDDPTIRQACADANLGIVFIAGGDNKYPLIPSGVGGYIIGGTNMALALDPNSYASPDTNPATGLPFANQSEQCAAELTNVLARLGVESGYLELTNAPILLTGHSAASPFVWVGSVATSAPISNRVFALLPYKGYYPSSIPTLMPVFHVSSEWQEISTWGNTWEDGDGGPSRYLRGQGTNRLYSEFVQPGTGHYNYPSWASGPVALFIKKAAQYRIPSNWPAAPLTTIDPTSGWLVDVTRTGSGVSTAVSYSAWTSAGKDARRAYWYFDQELAQTVCDAQNAGFSKKPQLVSGFQTPTQLAPLTSQPATNGLVYLNTPTFLADGITFKVRAVSLNQSPIPRLFSGNPVGMASGPIELKADGSGAIRQMGADTFRIWMSRCGNPYRLGQPWEPLAIAHHPGDSQYREADRPVFIPTSIPVFNVSGTAQTITFPAIPNQNATSLTNLTLNATSSSALTVQYWVVSGPYHCDPTSNAVIVPDTIPAQTKFPARVVVGAWQWGRNNAPTYQSAPAVYQTFWIFQDAFQAWQYANFGSQSTGSDGASYWNPLPASAAGNADPDGDGLSNTNEFFAGTNPANPASAFKILSIATVANDVVVTWQTAGGKTNVVQAVDGDYSTNYFDVSGSIIVSGSGDTTTNYVDAGVVTNAAPRFYRIGVKP